MAFGKSCEDLSRKSQNVYTSSIRDQRNCRKSSTKSERRNLSCFSYSQDFYDQWWSDSIECYCYLRNLQDFLRDGKTPWERRFGESFKGPIIPFGALVEYHPNLNTWSNENSSIFERKFHQESFWDMHWSRRGLWKGDYDSRFGRLEIWKHQNFILGRIIAKEILIRQKGDEFIGTGKLSGRGLRIPRTHSKAGKCRKEVNISEQDFMANGRVSTCTTWTWRWSPCRFLVDSRWLHQSPSQWTSSSTLCAEWRNIPYSTEVFLILTSTTHTDLDVKQETRVDDVWNVDLNSVSHSWKRFHKINIVARKNLPRDICGPVRDWQKFKQLPDQIMYGMRDGPELEKPLRREKPTNGQLKSPN